MAPSPALSVQIVTPEGVALSASVDELTAPGADGDFGVLPGHRPLMSALRSGIVTYRQGRESVRVAVGPGFAEVADDRVVILTDRFCAKDAIDTAQARQELLQADQALASADLALGSPEHGDWIRRERWAAVQLELCGDPPPATMHTVYEFQTYAHADFSSESDPESKADSK